MKVKCLNNRGHALPASYFSYGYTPQSEFDIVVGQTYTVYAMFLSKEGLSYLIDPEADVRPNWYPAILFEILDKRLPRSWQFSFTPQDAEYGVLATWGYEEVANSEAHFNGLADRDTGALRVFFRRRTEIDKECS